MGKKPSQKPGKPSSKTIVITGGNTGLGYYLGMALLELGHKVALIDINIENAQKLDNQDSFNLLVYKCDVRIEKEINLTVESIIKTWGRIDVLVNNAALAIFKPFEDKPLSETHDEFDINYFGYVRMIRAVLPQMKRQGEGIIHNVSSAVGVTGFKGISGYSSTKGAIEALSKTLSIELLPLNITVSLIHPPLMNTTSAAPLGIPAQVMEDPEVVGRKLAERIFSGRSIITPDFKTRMFLKISYLIPGRIGRFLSRATDREKSGL